jgi:hypothetical protein
MWHKRLFGLMLFVIMAMSLAVNVDAPARAQGPDEEDDDVLVEIEGELEVVGDDLAIDGTVVAPAGAFNPSRYMGECLAVTGRVLDDDTLQAVSAEPCEDEGEDADDGEDEDEDEDEDADEGGCGREGHPVLTAYSEEFDVPYEDLAELHCDGNGMGEIGRALLLADATGLGYEEILAMREDMGWGQIKKELMEEYDLSPRDLAPGRVISGRHAGEDDEVSGQRTPPGQGKDKNKDKGQGRGRK